MLGFAEYPFVIADVWWMHFKVHILSVQSCCQTSYCGRKPCWGARSQSARRVHGVAGTNAPSRGEMGLGLFLECLCDLSQECCCFPSPSGLLLSFSQPGFHPDVFMSLSVLWSEGLNHITAKKYSEWCLRLLKPMRDFTTEFLLEFWGVFVLIYFGLRRKISEHRLEANGATLAAEDHFLGAGNDHERPSFGTTLA